MDTFRHILFCCLVFCSFASSAKSQITIDNVPAEAQFSDGDSFRILSGPLAKSRARVVGINALEAYGPVHQWGAWKANELYDISKEATKMAQKNGWNCHSLGEKDVYGRILMECTDLAQALLKKGLAHAMFLQETPSVASYVSYQKAAQDAGEGMWKKGVPSFIVTSVHSITEFQSPNATSYDRIVELSGYGKALSHQKKYADCELVCYQFNSNEIGSCMIYVAYENRYGAKRPACLR